MKIFIRKAGKIVEDFGHTGWHMGITVGILWVFNLTPTWQFAAILVGAGVVVAFIGHMCQFDPNEREA